MHCTKLASSLDCSAEEVEAVYAGLFKTTEEDRNKNCRLCGFGSCEQMAAAIILEMRQYDDCLNFDHAKRKAVLISEMMKLVEHVERIIAASEIISKNSSLLSQSNNEK